MPTTDRTDTWSERSAGLTPTTMLMAHPAQLHPAVDTSDDPSSAAIVWPFVMFLIYAALALGFVIAR